MVTISSSHLSLEQFYFCIEVILPIVIIDFMECSVNVTIFYNKESFHFYPIIYVV